MEVLTKRIPFRSRRTQFSLHCLGDIHAGVKHCAEEKIRAKVKYIKEDPFALWLGMGDYCDAIPASDKRWDTEGIADWVERSNIAESQRKWVRDLFKPIKDKCIGLMTGNHEESIRIYNYQDIHLDLCRDLGVPNLGYSCFVRFQFVRAKSDICTFIGHFEHGSGGAATEGGKMMRLKKGLNDFDAHIYAMGHLHDIKTISSPRLVLSANDEIREQNRVGAITGSWMKTYSQGISPSYAEKRGYSPTNIGCPVFLITPDKNIIRVIDG